MDQLRPLRGARDGGRGAGPPGLRSVPPSHPTQEVHVRQGLAHVRSLRGAPEVSRQGAQDPGESLDMILRYCNFLSKNIIKTMICTFFLFKS